MPPRCSICDHPERQAIDRALVDGATLRAIARQFLVGRDAVRRHRKNGHVIESMVKASEAADAARGDDLLTRVRDLEGRALRILDRAEREGKLRTALYAIREARTTIQLLAATERQRIADENGAISIDDLMFMVRSIIDIVHRHIPSREKRKAIAAEIRLIPKPGGGAAN